MRVLPLFYRRRISGLAKVNLVVVLKLETIKPGFKSNPFCPQRQRVLQYSALPQLRFHFYTKGPFHLFIDIRFCSKGIGWISSSFWNPHFLWPAWHHSLWIFFFLYSVASHPQPLDLLFTFCFYCNLGFSCKLFPFSLYMHYQMAEDLFPPVEHNEVQFLLLCWVLILQLPSTY